MPGQKINQKQIGLYMTYRKEGHSQVTAAAKAGFSERSARNIQRRDHRPAKINRQWRTRPDPFAHVWDTELVPLLEQEPGLQARTLLDHLQRKYPEDYSDSKLRTLERRVRKWRATHGPEREVIFRQKQPPGWQGLSDFTNANALNVTINGQRLEHNLYHYRLAYSGWEYAAVVLGGESYSALTENLQNALWQCGGSPQTHRTDSLSAAFKNLSKETRQDLTTRYEEFCAHYGMEPTRNNKGVSHENGSIESSHRHFKNRLDQELLLRGSRDFESVTSYKQFVREVMARNNRRVHKKYLEELAELHELPEVKTTDFTEERARVTTSSTIRVRNVLYSVPSRLIGMTLKVHLYDDRLDCFIGGDHTLTLTRQRYSQRHQPQINYRHFIEQLVRKPAAFRNYVFREHCFPTFAFRQTWERLEISYGGRRACREYVRILRVAAQGDREERVSRYLERQLLKQACPTADEVEQLFKEASPELPRQSCDCDSLESYGALLKGGLA